MWDKLRVRASEGKLCNQTIYCKESHVWGNTEKGFIMKSDKTCLFSCSIRIKISLTEHSTSGTYYLELNETRCQFWKINIHYKNFEPTLLSGGSTGNQITSIFLVHGQWVFRTVKRVFSVEI